MPATAMMAGCVQRQKCSPRARLPRRAFCVGALVPGWLAGCVLALMAAPLAAEPITVTDDAGRTVTLEAPAGRIVTLAPHLAEMLFAVGAGEQVVGVSRYSDYPEAAQRLPRIGDARGVDMEAVLALEPDLVVAWGSAPQDGAARRLQSLEMPVFYSEPASLDGIADTMERLGRLSGHARQASGVAVQLREDVEALAAAYRVPEDERLRVFYEIWHQPLMTVGGGHFISEVIELCGGRNIFHALKGSSPRVDMEAVLAHDPQVILGTAADDDDRSLARRWATYPEIHAVSRQQVFTLPPDLIGRPTPRLLAGARMVCERLEKAR